MKKLIASIVSIGIILTGCASGASPEANKPKPKKIRNEDVSIAVILKSQNASYWDYVKKGAQDAADELKIKVYFDAPELESQPELQVDMINKAAKDASAIVISPINWQQASPLKDAVNANVPVVLIDSDCTNFDPACFIATNSEEAGRMAGREAAKILINDEDGLGGTCAIVAHTLGSDTANARFDGFSKELQEVYGAEMTQEKTDNKINITSSLFCDSDYDVAKERTAKLLDSDPDIDLLYCTNETVSRGAVDAVREKGLAGKIKIIGFDSSDDLIAAVNDGTMEGFLVQNPYQMGYLGVKNAVSLLKNEEVEANIDTGVAYVTKDNINSADMQHILDPLNN